MMIFFRLRSELRRTWRGLLGLIMIVALFGGVVLVAFAGARRTSTAVDRFVRYSMPIDGQVAADPRTFDAIAALPEVAYTQVGALFLAGPTSDTGEPIGGGPGSVLVFSIIKGRGRAIVVSGRMADPSRADEAMINESAAQTLDVGVGSTIHLRGYRPDELNDVLSGNRPILPSVVMPDVRVVGIIRQPTDIAFYPVPSDVTFLGTGAVDVGSAFFEQTSAIVAHFEGLSFKLRHGTRDEASFVADVERVAGKDAQVQGGSDAQTAATAAKRGTSLQAFALLLFAGIAALSLLIVAGQSIARQTYLASDDYPTLRALGASRAQLFGLGLLRGAIVAAAGMLLALPIAYALSTFTPIGLARRAEVTPGFSFDVLVLLGGAAALALVLVGRAAIAAFRVSHMQIGVAELERARASAVAEGMARAGMAPAAVSGVRLAFEPGHGRTAVPVRSTIVGTAVALAALVSALVFGFSLNHLARTPSLAGWNWDVAVGNPHSGDVRAGYEKLLKANPDVAAFSATAMGGGQVGGKDVVVAGVDPVVGRVLPPMLAGRFPAAPDEIALGGIVMRRLHKKVGDALSIPEAHATLHIVGEVVLSPQIVNQQEQLGGGGVMTIEGAQALSPDPLPVNVFLVRMKNPRDSDAMARLKQQFPGVVLPALAAPEIHNLQGVSSFPLVLASVLTLLAVATIVHTLVTSVRRRGRDLAILKTLGFVRGQVRAAVAWQSSALVFVSVLIGLPLGAIAGRWAWTTYADHNGLRPVPVLSLLLLVLIPGALLIANVAAAFPARTAARTQPAVVLRAE